jgi:hypothetical protein
MYAQDERKIRQQRLAGPGGSSNDMNSGGGGAGGVTGEGGGGGVNGDARQEAPVVHSGGRGRGSTMPAWMTNPVR